MQEYRLPRYVAMRNRLVGGLLVTVRLHAERPPTQCTSRFAHAAMDCYEPDRWRTAPFGVDTVFRRGGSLYDAGMRSQVSSKLYPSRS